MDIKTFAIVGFLYTMWGVVLPQMAKDNNSIKIGESCSLEVDQYEEKLNLIIEDLLNIPYSPSKRNDCSGIYYQAVQQLASECSNASIPAITKYRSSADFAAFLNGKSLLFKAEELAPKDVRLGTTLFYGYSRKRINHVALVVNQELDDKGELVSYTIFHGRKPGIPSSLTKVKVKDHRRKSEALALWEQSLLYWSYIENMID